MWAACWQRGQEAAINIQQTQFHLVFSLFIKSMFSHVLKSQVWARCSRCALWFERIVNAWEFVCLFLISVGLLTQWVKSTKSGSQFCCHAHVELFCPLHKWFALQTRYYMVIQDWHTKRWHGAVVLYSHCHTPFCFCCIFLLPES